MRWLKLELKLLFAGLAAQLALAVLVLAGGLAIYLGSHGYQQVQRDQHKVVAQYQSHIEQLKQKGKEKGELPDAGDFAYYGFAPTRWQLSPWSALFVGQSQDAYSSMRVRALALQGQIYNREIVNPSRQKAGRLDLGFVFTWLLPVVLGLLSVTLLSDERHAGRWRMLNALPLGGFSLVVKRLLLRAALVVLLSWSLLLAAALVLSLPLDGTFAWLLMALLVYSLFWLALIGWIISWGKSSVHNSLSFISLWLFISVLLPGLVHLYLQNQFANDQPLQATLKQRMVMNDGWDQDQQAALDHFLQSHPQFKATTPLTGSGEWKWYYAQQHLSDMAADKQWQAYQQIEQLRLEKLNQLSYLSPSLLFQLHINRLAGSGSDNQLDYLQKVADYHQQIRRFIYPYLFLEQPFTAQDIDAFPVWPMDSAAIKPAYSGLMAWALWLSALLLLVGWRLKGAVRR